MWKTLAFLIVLIALLLLLAKGLRGVPKPSALIVRSGWRFYETQSRRRERVETTRF